MPARRIYRRPSRTHLHGHPSVPIATRVSEDVRRLVDVIVSRRGADATVADYLRELIEADLIARGWDLRKAGPLPCATLLHVAEAPAGSDVGGGDPTADEASVADRIEAVVTSARPDGVEYGGNLWPLTRGPIHG